MSLISSMIVENLIKAIEEEFVKHAPDIQAGIIQEVEDLAQKCTNWVASKMGARNAAS